MSKRFIALAGAVAALLAAVLLLRTGTGAWFVWMVSSGGQSLLPLVAVAALIDSINPCAFSILLLTVGFLLSLGTARGAILKTGAFYILGIFSVYVLIGLGLLQALHVFNTPHFMAKLGAGILILAGALNVLGHLFPRFPVRLRIPEATHRSMAMLMRQSSLPAAFLLGGLVGLCEFPCTGGPYLMVLGLLHDQQTYLRGLAYLAIYNLIFVLPLMVLLFLASEASLIAKVAEWKKNKTGAMRLWGGLAMIALGLLVLAW